MQAQQDNNYHASQVNAYKMARATVSKTRQVVMLYEGVIKFMMQAREAIEQNKIEDRYNSLVKANDVLIALQNSLDFEKGGTMAHVLHDFYSDQINAIYSMHENGSSATCDRVISEVKDMLETWRKIDAQAGGNVASPTAVNAISSGHAPDSLAISV